jgi:hypothetical protein
VWDESTAFDVAEYFGLKESVVNEIVNYCGVVGLFDKGLLTRGSVLTSQSIQRRYIEMCNRAKRTNCLIPNELKLQEISRIIPEESAKLPEESPQTSESLPQSKGKESKEEESKEENTLQNFLLIFDEFRKKYPGTKKGNATEFENFKKKHKDWKEVLPTLSSVIDNQIRAKEIRRQNGAFVPEWKNLQTWINQRCWEEEYGESLSDFEKIKALRA